VDDAQHVPVGLAALVRVGRARPPSGDDVDRVLERQVVSDRSPRLHDVAHVSPWMYSIAMYFMPPSSATSYR
jgi:hypothetical protein